MLYNEIYLHLNKTFLIEELREIYPDPSPEEDVKDINNYCRICSEFFCCKICRLRHEETDHGIHPECNICIYGRAFLENPSESLLEHFKVAHWPLHCLFCKTLFTSVENLILHSTCTMAQKFADQENSNIFMISSAATPVTEENYDSPPITATMHKSILTSSNKHRSDHNHRVSLTTSTPMQKLNERELLQHIPEVITPVDYSEKTNISDKLKSINASSINSVTSEQSKDAEPPLKRRVTFSDIEFINIETPYHSRKPKYIPSYEMNSESKQQQFFNTPEFSTTTNKNATTNSRNEHGGQQIYDDRCKSDMYVTANDWVLGDTPKVLATQEHKNAYKNYIALTRSLGTTNDDTAWESALMDPHVSTSDIPFTAINENLTEFINSTKSDILSPIVNQNLIESNILSPIMDSNLTQSNVLSPVVNENVTKSEIQTSITNFSETKQTFLSPVVNQNLIEPENIQSHIIILDSNLVNSEMFSVVVKQNLTEIDTLPIMNSKEVLSPEMNPSLEESDFLLSPVDFLTKPEGLKILSPITNKDLTSKIVSSNMESNLESETDNKDTNYDALEFSTISGQAHNMNSSSQKSGIWSSMTNIFKTVVQGLSGSTRGNNSRKSSLRISLNAMNSTALNDCITKTNTQSSSHKRSKPEVDASGSESPIRKKIKLTHIQCRKTIRNVRPFLELQYGRKNVHSIDKWTQTE